MFNRLKNNKASNDIPVVRPNADIYETEKEIVLELEFPGIQKESLTVEIEGDSLVISGVKKRDATEEKYTALYQERDISVEYRREFQLNVEVDHQKISASYQEGVLKIVLVKAQTTQAQKITIAS